MSPAWDRHGGRLSRSVCLRFVGLEKPHIARMAEENDDEFDISFGDDEFGLANSTFNSVVLNETAESSFGGAESEADPDDAGLLPPSSASTPKKTRFKKPKLPPPKYFKKCVRCGEYLKTEHGFVKHQKTHRWKGT